MNINEIIKEIKTIKARAAALNAEALSLNQRVDELEEAVLFETRILIPTLERFKIVILGYQQLSAEKIFDERRRDYRLSREGLEELLNQAKEEVQEQKVQIDSAFFTTYHHTPTFRGSMLPTVTREEELNRLKQFLETFFGEWTFKQLLNKIDETIEKVTPEAKLREIADLKRQQAKLCEQRDEVLRQLLPLKGLIEELKEYFWLR
jgi:c-di-AMP phosphodiesterase-like protein